MAVTAPPIDPKVQLAHRLSLLIQVIGRLAISYFTPHFVTKDDPVELQKLADRVPLLVEVILLSLPEALLSTVKSLQSVLLDLANGEIGAFFKAAAKDWQALLDELFIVYRAVLAENKQIDPTQVDLVASAALEEASILGIGSFAVTALFELFLPKQLNSFNWLGPTLAKLSGYEEIVGLDRGPQLKHAIGNLAEYNAAQTFRTRAPEGREGEQLYTRRLISKAQYQRIVGWSGLMSEFEDPKLLAAYRPVSVRALATAFVDTTFPEQQIEELLQFTGNRDSDIALLLPALRRRSLANVTQGYLGALQTAAERGDLTDQELDDGLTVLEFSDEARGLVHLTVATRKLQQLNELYRKSISEGYRFGEIDDASYVPHLEAIGIAAADAQAHYAIDSMIKNGKAAAELARELKSEAAKEQSAAVKAALAAFSSGSTNAVELAGQLLAAGLSPALIASAVSIAEVRRSGSTVRIYGQILPFEAAAELRAKVAAIGAQTTKKLITTDAAIGQLAELNVPGVIREALVAKWAATGPKTLLPP